MEQCIEHGAMCSKIEEISSNTEKIIIGMYGDLQDTTKEGFIHEVNREIKSIRSTVDNIKNSISKIAWVAVITFITAGSSFIAENIIKLFQK